MGMDPFCCVDLESVGQMRSVTGQGFSFPFL